MANSVANNSLDDYLSSTPVGPIQTAIGNNLYGINHRQTPGAVPINKDNYGLTFFVRPQLNMRSDNLRNMRKFTNLLTNESTSIQTIVRCLLDPRLMANIDGNTYGSRLDCPFVDNANAFIPVMSNHLKSITGWPDTVIPTMESKPGSYKESHIMVDGIADNYSSYDITATFRNSKGDPIFLLMYVWAHYMSAVFEGMMMPYPDMITSNEIDSNTRIYRLILDPTKKYVQKIAACGVCFPNTIPTGGYFDYSDDKPINDANRDISIQFRCMGFNVLDPILIHEFNKTVIQANPSMDDGTIYTNYIVRDMVQIPDSLLPLFNNRGYPRVDPVTYELQWYVTKSYYARRLNAINAL